MNRHRLPRIVAAGVVAVVAGCSSVTSRDEPAVAGTPEACAVVQRDDFVAVGVGVDAPQEREANHATRCLYFLAGSNARVTVTVQDRTLGRRTFSAGRELVPASQVLPGLGDAAYWDPVTRTVHARVGAHHLMVATDGRVTRDQLVAVTTRGIARLPVPPGPGTTPAT